MRMNIIDKFFDILFPKKPAVERLEKMTPDKILDAVSSAVSSAGAIKIQSGQGRFFALFQYRHPIARQIVWEIKYRGNSKLASTVGQLLSEKILRSLGQSLGSLNLDENFLIIPIPISKKRLKQRGYSQTELIAKNVMENFPREMRNRFLYCPSVLVKIKETPSQTSLGNRGQRLSNLSGAFALKDAPAEEVVRGKNIILIDDVITTGATLEEACGVLLDNGAKSVIGFGIAH